MSVSVKHSKLSNNKDRRVDNRPIFCWCINKKPTTGVVLYTDFVHIEVCNLT